jgi:hypothetical protein
MGVHNWWFQVNPVERIVLDLKLPKPEEVRQIAEQLINSENPYPTALELLSRDGGFLIYLMERYRDTVKFLLENREKSEKIFYELIDYLTMLNGEEMAKDPILEAYKKSITPEKIVQFIKGEKDFLSEVIKNLRLDDPNVRKIIVPAYRKNWDKISSMLSNVLEVRETLIKVNPKLEPILKSPEGVKWLNQEWKRFMMFLYEYVWG